MTVEGVVLQELVSALPDGREEAERLFYDLIDDYGYFVDDDLIFQDIFSECFRRVILRLERQNALRGGYRSLNNNESKMVFRCLVSVSTLQDALEELQQFFSLVQSIGISLNFGVQDDLVTVRFTVINTSDNVGEALRDLLAISFYQRLIAWLVDEYVDFFDPKISQSSYFSDGFYSKLFGFYPGFQQCQCSFSFSSAWLKKTIRRDWFQLQNFLQDFPFDLPGWLDQHSLVQRVTRYCKRTLQQEQKIPNRQELAQQLGVSESTLRRSLRREGGSFSQLRDAQMLQWAEQLLRDEMRFSLEEVAERLGFQDTRSFRRAFRRWSGLSPREFRQRREG